MVKAERGHMFAGVIKSKIKKKIKNFNVIQYNTIMTVYKFVIILYYI